MKFLERTPRVLARPLEYMTSATAVVIAVGLIGSVLAATNASQVSKDLLLSKASTAAAAFSGQEVQSLQGNENDLNDPVYKSLRRRLISVREGDTNTRFAYLIGKNDKREVFFMVDSENERSTSYSPPGTIYPEASSQLRSVFYTNEPIIEGPLKDSYGNWVTAAAPVTNDKGEIVAVLGIDTPSSEYYRQIATYAVIPLLLASIPVAVLAYNRRLAKKEFEINELKTQFVSIASHELRSPLTGTLWGVQSLLKAKHTENQEATLTAIYSNIASSLATVNEILDFSIFQRGKKDYLQREIVDLKIAVKDVIKLHQLSASENHISITREGKWPKTALTIGDQGALKRAFGNILSNALKYSYKNGKVEISLRTEGGNHIIQVRDFGIGIPKSEQGKVLDGYYRATNTAAVKTYGTGMGLWISRMLIEQHGGKLWLESNENEGTVFYISLPAKMFG